MLCEVLTAGFGGQGVLFLGDLLTRSAMSEGKHVTYFPTYGVAMRGGTANVTVTVSDEPIGSPLLDEPDVAIILNEQSLTKFQPIVKPGGLIVANSSIIDKSHFNRDDVRIVWIDATETAKEVAGTDRSTNMAALGAFLGTEELVSLDTCADVLRTVVPKHRQAMVEKNIEVLHVGVKHAQSA